MKGLDSRASIGVRAMGSALAQALLRDGHHVTVWNRMSATAESLVKDGAVLTPSAVSAVSASPLVLVCVEDYKVTRSILETKGVAPALAGRLLVELSTGPSRTRETPRCGRGSEAPTTSMAP